MIVDRIVFQYLEVTPEEFGNLLNRFKYFEMNALIPEVRMSVGTSPKDYNYNLNIGSGIGGLYIGYKHNRCKEHEPHYSMKVEFNPQRLGKGEYVIEVIQSVLGIKPVVLTTLDLAYDVEVPLKKVQVISKNGVTPNVLFGTKMYMKRNNDGHLKIYDKIKDNNRRGLSSPEGVEHLTRIEYTWKDKAGININDLKPENIKISERYDVHTGTNEQGLKPEIRAYLFAIENGVLEIKDFSRTNQKHIKEAMDKNSKLDIDTIIKQNWSEIKSTITKYTQEMETASRYSA